MRKLSRKIIARMPVKTESDIRAVQRAQAKLTKAEALVDKFQAQFEATMAKDGLSEDQAELSDVVVTEQRSQKEQNFEFQRSEASNKQGYKRLSHRVFSVSPGNDFADGKPSTTLVLNMETQEPGRTLYTVTSDYDAYREDPSKVSRFPIYIEPFNKPEQYLLVTGVGEEREFRFSPLNRAEKLLESSGKLASKVAGLAEPLKKLTKLRIKLGG